MRTRIKIVFACKKIKCKINIQVAKYILDVIV